MSPKLSDWLLAISSLADKGQDIVNTSQRPKANGQTRILGVTYLKQHEMYQKKSLFT